ncbi:hypothetical protein ACPPVQ_00710 [Diaminobutyricibacter sp. McL0618]|uniref:hypothetical protein n=1 Tax=Leifsonia sp. McL0618 TaxID=3415677 RepID=UPI003CF9DC96
MEPEKRSKLRFPVRELVLIPVSVIGFAVILHWVYSSLLSPNFGYQGFRYTEPDLGVVTLTIIIAIAMALCLPRRIEKASAVVLWILYVVTVAPAVLMAPYTSYLDKSQAILLAVTVSLVFAGVALGTRGTNRPLHLSVSPTSFWLIIVVFSLATYALLAVTQGLSLRFVSFLDVYDVRDQYAENTGGVGFINYLVFTQANVVNPLIVARGIFTRRPVWVIAGLLGQMVLYSGTGFKTMIFAIPAWLIVAYLLRRRAKSADGLSLVWGAAILMLASAILDQLSHSVVWTSLFSRRFLATPGLLTSAYVDFFSQNPQTHLAGSILRPFLDFPYDVPVPFVIGSWMANSPNTAVNANLFADGFANFGWAGIVGAGAILLAYLRILDRAAVGLPIAVAGVVMTMPTIALSNTSILTAMFTHGLVAAVLLLAFTPRDFSLKQRRHPRAHEPRLMKSAENVPAGTSPTSSD